MLRFKNTLYYCKICSLKFNIMKNFLSLISALLIISFSFAQNQKDSHQLQSSEEGQNVETHITPSQKTFNERGAVQRKPLHEVFTSSTCGYCPPANSNIDGIVLDPLNADDATLIKYQVSWPGPGDPYNTPEVQTRRSYYGINSVPAFYVDAASESGTS